jgi:hypothetical protein
VTQLNGAESKDPGGAFLSLPLKFFETEARERHLLGTRLMVMGTLFMDRNHLPVPVLGSRPKGKTVARLAGAGFGG